VHRQPADWKKYARRTRPGTVEGRIYHGLQKLLALRKGHKAFSVGEIEILPTGNEHILGLIRSGSAEEAMIFANFSEEPQGIDPRLVERYSVHAKQCLHGSSTFSPQKTLTIEPLDLFVLI
jgi:amylosucrase